MTNDNPTVRCDMCDEEFDVEDDMRSHIDSMHQGQSSVAPRADGGPWENVEQDVARGADDSEHIGHQDLHADDERRAS